MYRSILVPLDDSQFGEHAHPLARAIACQADVVLHLAHVHAMTLPLAADTIALFDEESDAQDRMREQLYLDQLAQRIASGGDAYVRTALLDQPIPLALQNYALTHHIDLVVMATHERGAFARFWLGTIADRLVRHAPLPIVLIHAHARQPVPEQIPAMKRMLIPLDGSAFAERILPSATTLGALMNAELTLVHALVPQFVGYGDEWPTAMPGTHLPAQQRAAAQTYLDRIAERLIAQSLVVHTALVSGQPAPAILEYACDHVSDLIALATHGHGGAVRLLLGSVAEQIVHGTSTPVLLYRPPKQV